MRVARLSHTTNRARPLSKDKLRRILRLGKRKQNIRLKP